MNGWIEYKGEPASGVRVQVFLENERVKLTSENVTSDSNGNFSAILSIPSESEPGNYTVSVPSLCQEIHSDVCTYQWVEHPITVLLEINRIESILRTDISTPPSWAAVITLLLYSN